MIMIMTIIIMIIIILIMIEFIINQLASSSASFNDNQ